MTNDRFRDITKQWEPAEPSTRRIVPKEVKKVLNLKRWQQNDRPFRGFNSPPGRF